MCGAAGSFGNDHGGTDFATIAIDPVGAQTISAFGSMPSMRRW